MMSSRDTLAAQGRLAALLGNEPEYGGMRIAHEMLTTRIKVAIRDLAARIMAVATPPATATEATPH
eukprot:12886560-Prorocentrum_lima.AAC.1